MKLKTRIMDGRHRHRIITGVSISPAGEIRPTRAVRRRLRAARHQAARRLAAGEISQEYYAERMARLSSRGRRSQRHRTTRNQRNRAWRADAPEEYRPGTNQTTEPPNTQPLMRTKTEHPPLPALPSKPSIYLGALTRQLLARSVDPKDESSSVTLSGEINRQIANYHRLLQSIPCGPFTVDEWSAILEANNGPIWDDGGADCWPTMIWANLADSPELDSKWRIATRRLAARISKLPAPAQYRIGEVIHRFWGLARNWQATPEIADFLAREAPDCVATPTPSHS